MISQDPSEFITGLTATLQSFPKEYYNNGRLTHPVIIKTYGHCTAALGGRVTFQSYVESQMRGTPSAEEVGSGVTKILQKIAKILPSGKVTIENYSCFGFENNPFTSNNVVLARLLALTGGGEYRAEPSESVATWNDDEDVTFDESTRKQVHIGANASPAAIEDILQFEAGGEDSVQHFLRPENLNSEVLGYRLRGYTLEERHAMELKLYKAANSEQRERPQQGHRAMCTGRSPGVRRSNSVTRQRGHGAK